MVAQNLRLLNSSGTTPQHNNTMHAERRSPCVLKWKITCRRPVIVDVIPLSVCSTENMRMKSRPILQLRLVSFSLRSFFLAVVRFSLLIGIFAWWIRPYTIDEQWVGHPSVRVRFKLRRTLSGHKIHVGETKLIFTETNSAIAAAKTDGLRPEFINDWWCSDRIYTYRTTDGTQLDHAAWLDYISHEFGSKFGKNAG